MSARRSALVIDANNLISRAIFASALDDLRAGGRFTGGVFGALGSLRSILTNPIMLGVGAIYAFFDNGVPRHRMRALPDYKRSRREKREQMSEEERVKALGQIVKCYEIWPSLGVCCLSYRNREADDGVAAAVRVLLDEGVQPIVVTSDRDLFQTVQWGAEVYDLRTQELIDDKSFEQHSEGVPMDRWLLYRALVGDDSDGIKGAPGCGPKRARQLMLESEFADDWTPERQLSYLCASLREQHGAKKLRAFEQSVVDHEDHLKKVLSAISLRDSFGPTLKLSERMRQLPEVRKREFLLHCRDLQFNSILGDPSGTIDPFLAAQSRR